MRFAENAVEEFCQLTIAMLLLYFGAIMIQVYTKKKLGSECEKKGKKFTRYTDPPEEMIRADRCVANLLEWLPFFFGLLMTNTLFVITPSLQSPSPIPPLPFVVKVLAWSYVALRLGYVISVSSGNFRQNGIQKGLVMFTMPAYLCLLGLLLLSIGNCLFLF
uniref:Uncharacterized protein n=1 Tax=Paramoeba aestuarina TaxID=180227 RepID=A0A7S4NRT7_9EUKA